jgi:hypothetical protein
MVSNLDQERRLRIALEVERGAPRNEHYDRAPRGEWLVARTRTRLPYPCRCNPYGVGRGCNQLCPCRGRRDRRPELGCCARRAQAKMITP